MTLSPAALRQGARKTIMFVIAFGLVAGAWEGYKAIGPERSSKVLGWKIIPSASDQAMPHIGTMFSRLAKPEVRGNGTTIFHAVALATWYSFRVALFALVLGVIVGLLLGVVMARFRITERAIMPYLIVSQTIPLIALAPVLVSWSGRLKPFGFQFEKQAGGFLGKLSEELVVVGEGDVQGGVSGVWPEVEPAGGWSRRHVTRFALVEHGFEIGNE